MIDGRAPLLDASLERASEELGDITPAVLALFYGRFPQAEAAFHRLSLGDTPSIAGRMIETGLYCMTTWLERRAEVEVVFMDSVPHHADTLDVPVDWYRGLFESLVDVVAATVPPTAVEERALLTGLRREIGAAIDNCRRYAARERAARKARAAP